MGLFYIFCTYKFELYEYLIINRMVIDLITSKSD